MHKLTTPLAIMAMAATLVSVSPALAQNHPNRNPPMGIDCSLPENASNPACLPDGKSKHRDRDHDKSGNGSSNSDGNGGNGSGNGGSQGSGSGQGNGSGQGAGSGNSGGNNSDSHHNDKSDHHSDNNNNNNNDDHHDNNGGMDHGPQNGSFNWSRHDRDHFHQQFRGFNFGFFANPGFSIHIGTTVPRSFDLRPVPRNIYRDYPWFRGYLFFVTRSGDIVIVSPRSHRIVGVI